MRLIIEMDIDLEQSSTRDPGVLAASALACLAGPTNDLRNPFLSSVEEALGEALAAVGVFASEDTDMRVRVEP